MTSRYSTIGGAQAVFSALACTFSTAVFFPGILLKVGIETIVARAMKRQIEITGFLAEFGGEVESGDPDMAWTEFLVWTTFSLYGLGALLMLPSLIRAGLLDIRPFAAVSADHGLIISRETSFFPLYDLINRYGYAEFYRLWFGVSAVVCSLPASRVLDGALQEQRARPRGSFKRLTLVGPLTAMRLLRSLDRLLTYFLLSGYLVSGLLVGYLSWRIGVGLVRLLIV